MTVKLDSSASGDSRIEELGPNKLLVTLQEFKGRIENKEKERGKERISKRGNKMFNEGIEDR